MLDGLFNLIFGWAINISPLFGIAVVSFVLTALITIIYKYATDQEVMKSLKEELKEMQKEIKSLKDNPAKMMEAQKRAMEKNMKYMMHSFKPMIITFIPIIIIFGWLRATYSDVGYLIWKLNWLWTYILFSLIFSFIIRKMLKVH